MITAVDTNVLIDVLEPNQSRLQSSRTALARARFADSLVICEVVYSELAGRFTERSELDRFLGMAGVGLVPCNEDSLYLAGTAWVQYARRRPQGLACAQCGTMNVARCRECETVLSARQRILPDFYVGAHALIQADRLLTRDRGYYSGYFPDLELI